MIKASLISLLNEKHLRSDVISKMAREVANDAVTPTRKADTVIKAPADFAKFLEMGCPNKDAELLGCFQYLDTKEIVTNCRV